MPKAESVADWAPAAAGDVDEIWDYYAAVASPETAGRMVAALEVAATRVAAHPFHGRSRSDLRLGLRSVRVAPYLLFYRSSERGVQVVRVLHERRDLPAALQESEK